MRKVSLCVLVLLLSFSESMAAQEGAVVSDFQKFLGQVNENFILPLNTEGMKITNTQRAMILGFLLQRQEESLEDFDTDRARMDGLIGKVKAFLNSLDPDSEDLWTAAERAYKGQSDDQVLQLMGGSPRYVPVFRSIGESGKEGEVWDVNFEEFDRSQGVSAFMNDFFGRWKSRHYEKMRSMFGGRMAREFSNSIIQIRENPEMKSRMDSLADQLQWTLKEGKVSTGEPRRVALKYAIKDQPDTWHDYSILLLMDSGNWKIIKFDQK